MHNTYIPDVKGYIDIQKFNTEDHTIHLKGWVFHETKNQLLPMRINIDYHTDEHDTPNSSSEPEKKSNVIIISRENIQKREDVAAFYKNSNILFCGWEITFPLHLVNSIFIPKDYFIQLQVFVQNEWMTYLNVSLELPMYQVTLNTSLNVHKPPSFLVIDNVYQDPDSVREYALHQTFVEHPKNHKGKRTDTCYRFKGLKELFESNIGVSIKSWNHYGTNGCFQYCTSGEQLVYHHDAQDYAGVLFLTPDAPPQSGTTFFRSKHTKKMKVEVDEHPLVFRNGFLDPTEFEVVDVVGNVYNRLVLFDAKMIHAASCYFGTSKENGRLFQLFFFDIDRQ